ncbi:MIP18 family protein galla-2-like [Sycon ciliatum]|uniref:MIP18 family protein galla-2-like n=1 Tax=Sycon ciliatum TaxID=27933 RepID=UPI0020AD4C7D|eukprot:scpid58365/ scgid35081/ MIP18 family protein CG7949
MAGQQRLDNANPNVFAKTSERIVTSQEEDDDTVDEFDRREIFDLIRGINDPEHPFSLEELNVLRESHVEVDNTRNCIKVVFTPTIPHCSMATLIGLSIRVKLLRALPPRFKVDISIEPGTHASELAVNKQLGDKERVAAALENNHLLDVVNQCLAGKEAS